jgi:hypothetical protein
MRRSVRALVGIAVVGLGALGGTAPASAAQSSTPPTDCQAAFSPYDYTPSALRSCGITTYPATVSKTADGGELYSYSSAVGLFAETIVPPAGFDPAVAPSAQLAEYGYPPRPQDPLADAQWLTLIA